MPKNSPCRRRHVWFSGKFCVFLLTNGIRFVITDVACRHTSYTLIPAYEQAARIVDASPRPPAVFCTALELAIGLNRYCHEQGIHGQA